MWPQLPPMYPGYTYYCPVLSPSSVQQPFYAGYYNTSSTTPLPPQGVPTQQPVLAEPQWERQRQLRRGARNDDSRARFGKLPKSLNYDGKGS